MLAYLELRPGFAHIDAVILGIPFDIVLSFTAVRYVQLVVETLLQPATK